MRDSVIWFLATAVLVSALFVVKYRHEHRVSYLTYRAEQERRDNLNDEWGQLLIEENLWSFPHRIEKDAKERLSMRTPTFEETHYLTLEQGLATKESVRSPSNLAMAPEAFRGVDAPRVER